LSELAGVTGVTIKSNATPDINIDLTKPPSYVSKIVLDFFKPSFVLHTKYGDLKIERYGTPRFGSGTAVALSVIGLLIISGLFLVMRETWRFIVK